MGRGFMLVFLYTALFCQTFYEYPFWSENSIELEKSIELKIQSKIQIAYLLPNN